MFKDKRVLCFFYGEEYFYDIFTNILENINSNMIMFLNFFSVNFLWEA